MHMCSFTVCVAGLAPRDGTPCTGTTCRLDCVCVVVQPALQVDFTPYARAGRGTMAICHTISARAPQHVHLETNSILTLLEVQPRKHEASVDKYFTCF